MTLTESTTNSLQRLLGWVIHFVHPSKHDSKLKECHMFEQLSNVRNVLPSRRSFRDMKPIARRELRNGLIFIAPWIVGFLAFTFLPIIATFLFSFMDLKITSGILSK